MLAVLQLDSVGVPLVERLLAEGRLPALAGLTARGRWHALETPAAVLAAAAYPSLYTGLDVGEHGLYYPFQWCAAEQRVRPAAAFEKPPLVWDRVGRAGRRSLVVDAYESWPPRSGVGAFLSGWQFENRVVLQPWSEPPALRPQLARRLGRAPAVDEVFGRPSARLLARLRRRLLEAPARVARAVVELLAGGRFDHLWVCFPAAHLAGHQLWDLSQLDGSEAERARRAGLENALADVYEAVDAAMGTILAALPGDADVVVLSPLGMGGNVSRVDLLPGMLEAVLAPGRPREGTADSFLWRLRAAVPTGARARAARALPPRAALELTARLATRGADWSRVRAFTLPGDHHGHVRLNVRGRERDGIVAPAEAEALAAEIADGLSTFEDDGGGPCVRDVLRAADLYAGPKAGLLPDLIVSWADRPPARAGVCSPRFGAVARRGTGTGRSGNHTGEAWVLLAPGASRERALDRAPRIVDVAATVVAVLDADTAGLHGEPLLEPS